MRIYGNRLLKTLPGQATRPTSARVREALFNIWQGSITDCHWLDLCAGNGSMGAEALCRGAEEVIGIEQSGRAYHIIHQNWQQVAKPNQHFQVLRGDILVKLKTLAGKQFERIYFDPPYSRNLYQPVLEMIVEGHFLTSDGEIAVEHNPKSWQAREFMGLEICREKNYGKTTLTFYSRSDHPKIFSFSSN
jgi:16S rRNA (guanine(966)-N(2))-methyltransferase RsmD